MRLALTRATAIAFASYLLFGQRLTVAVSTGGRGTLSLPMLLFLGLSIALWLRLNLQVDGPQAKGLLLPTLGPLFALLALLPLIGVLLGDYDLRALASVLVVLVPTSILVLGTAAARWGVDIRGPVLLAVIIQGLYGLGQLLSRVGVMPPGLWSWAVNWDAQTQAAYSESYLISARSTGLFLNPNEFGLWSVLAVIFGALYLQSWRRSITVLLGVIGVYASQSRTAWLALAVLALAYVASLLRRPASAKAGIIPIVLTSVGVGILAMFGVFSRLVESGAGNRFETGLAALMGGASQDANLSGRYLGWARASEFVQNYAFGTLGPPQLKFGNSIDNQFVSYYLQGGALLVSAYILVLIAPFLVLRRRVAQSWKLMLVAVTFAIFSYTSLPMDSSMSSALAWICAILSVQTSLRLEKNEPDSAQTDGPAQKLASFPADLSHLGRPL